MLWRELIPILDSSTIVILQEKTRDAEYHAAELLGDDLRPLSPGVVYFATLPQLDRLTAGGVSLPPRLALFLRCDRASTIRLPAEAENVVQLPTQDAFLTCFAALSGAFQRASQLAAGLQDALGLLTGAAGMDDIAQHISAVYQHSVGIYDTLFTIIGRSSPAGFRRYRSGDLLDDLATGYIAPEYIRRVQSEQDLNYFADGSSTPVLIQHYRQEFKHYSTPILIGSSTAGFFSVFLRQEEDLTAVERLYLTRFAKLISIAMQRNDYYTANKSHFFTNFFASMLSDQGDFSKDWEGRIRAYGYNIKSSMHMVVVRFSDALHGRSELNQMVSTLYQLFPGCIYCVQYDLIILFCSNDPGKFSMERAVQHHDLFFAGNGLKLGVSSEFHALSAMRTHFDQAVEAIEVGSIFAPQESFYLYDELIPHSMVYQLSKQMDVLSFCYPPFMALLDYDREKRSNLAQTLFCYLLDAKNPAAVCQKLQIHKNTLYFRLDKARSVMGVSADRLGVATQIFFTVLILRLTGKVSWDIPQLPAGQTGRPAPPPSP